jgi:tetratricopeptide (TPR) repeat protein
LAADIRRYLMDEPIDARPASTFYQLGKFARRNKGLVVGTLFAFVALGAGLAATGYGMMRARASANLAQEESQRARDALADVGLVAGFQDAIIRGINVQEMGQSIKDEINAQIDVDASSISFADAMAKVNPATLARGVVDESMLSKALQTARERFADRPAIQAKVLQALCETYFALGMYDQSLKVGLDALALKRKSLGDDHPDTVTMIGNIAHIYNNAGSAKDALPYAEEALKRRRAALPDDDKLVLEAYYRLASTKRSLRQLDEAVEICKKIVATADRVLDPDDDHRLLYRQMLANTYVQMGRQQDALPIREQLLEGFRRMRGENDPLTLGAWSQLAQTQSALGHLEESQAALEEIVRRADKTLGESDPRSMRVLQSLAEVQAKRGETQNARESFQALLERQRKTLPPNNPAIDHTIKLMEKLGAPDKKGSTAPPHAPNNP